ncbi:neurogenic locus notch homolog protein 1-like isoform X1 [Branchiostoma floridae]|uniref:Neurogenic locus notch homolog protein 1-like isoform X1 n=2 Tax=Branchiostoma floridae TaxID=7739 RepID=A0A9J7MYY3_BRAFL|nr:neurogenic locus notch homolog protein 1-like isoform X1 [Branchiostoma floridae]
MAMDGMDYSDRGPRRGHNGHRSRDTRARTSDPYQTVDIGSPRPTSRDTRGRRPEPRRRDPSPEPPPISRGKPADEEEGMFDEKGSYKLPFLVLAVVCIVLSVAPTAFIVVTHIERTGSYQSPILVSGGGVVQSSGTKPSAVHYGNLGLKDSNDCDPNPCVHNGNCTDGINSFTCTCPEGYEGRFCEKNINDCNRMTRKGGNVYLSKHLCANGGTCIDKVNDYECYCAPGFTGKDCGRNIEDCTEYSCLNGGTCKDGINSFSCHCPAGYTGRICEINSDDCLPNPCENNGTCIDGVNSYSCVCLSGYAGANCETSESSYRDCAEIYKNWTQTSGVYYITPQGAPKAILVYCDMTTAGGGWTVFQRRVDGAVTFYRNWTEYQHGFGNIDGDYWLGNDNIHMLTSQGHYILRVDLSDWEGNSVWAQYNNFTVEDEEHKYRLHLGAYSGSAGDALTNARPVYSNHNNMYFSTYDQNNDKATRQWNCAKRWQSGWWYNNCYDAHLNGVYHHSCSYKEWDGIIWLQWKDKLSLRTVSLKMRPADFQN